MSCSPWVCDVLQCPELEKSTLILHRSWSRATKPSYLLQRFNP